MQQPVHLLLSDQEAAAFRRSRRNRRIVLVIGLTILIVALALTVPRMVRHVDAVAGFALVGGTVDWNIDRTNWRHGGVTHVEFQNGRTLVTDTALRRLKELHAVQAVDLADCDLVTEAGLVALKDLPELQQLDLSRTQPVHGFLTADTPPKKLTDAALIPLQNMTQLTDLSLAGNLITDDGLARLSGLKNLEALDLQDTQISDAGLKHLVNLKRLKTLNLAGTKVTKKAAMVFEQSLGGITELNVGVTSDSEAADGDR